MINPVFSWKLCSIQHPASSLFLPLCQPMQGYEVTVRDFLRGMEEAKLSIQMHVCSDVNLWVVLVLCCFLVYTKSHRVMNNLWPNVALTYSLYFLLEISVCQDFDAHEDIDHARDDVHFLSAFKRPLTDIWTILLCLKIFEVYLVKRFS